MASLDRIFLATLPFADARFFLLHAFENSTASGAVDDSRIWAADEKVPAFGQFVVL